METKFVGGEEEVWLTSCCFPGDDAVSAAVLGASLRSVVSTKRSGVFVANNISDEDRRLLSSNFDALIPVESNVDVANVDMKSWMRGSLPFVARAAFVPNTSLFLSSADDVFFDKDAAAAAADVVVVRGTKNNGGGDDGGAQVTVFRPDNKLSNNKKKTGERGEMEEEQRRVGCYATVDLRGGNNSSWMTPPTSNDGSRPTEIALVTFIEGTDNKLMKRDWEKLVGSCDQLGQLEKALVRLWVATRDEVLHRDANKIPSSPGVDPNTAIAIVGMSCRLPGNAHSPEEYWKNVLSPGLDCISRRVPPHRWPSAVSEDFRSVPAGFLTCPVDMFDGRFFGISPADLVNTDPQQRLLMEVTWEAIEDAGVDYGDLKGAGVFVGSWTTDYRDLINGVDVDSELGEFHRLYLGNSLGGTGGRLSYLLGMTGPNVATESGCSSGMVGVYLAVEALRAGRCDLAVAGMFYVKAMIVGGESPRAKAARSAPPPTIDDSAVCDRTVEITGGVNLLLHPFKRKHMQSIISSDGRCKTFDESADGFGRGEGVASLVLERYSTAVARGRNILGVITGTGIAQEGISRSFGTPTKEVQEMAMRAALRDANIPARAVTYVEAHGTGTMVGDPVEVAAIAGAYYDKDRTRPLIIGSGKTNIGHTESCSGLAGIIKVLLSMKHKSIPPHINLTTVNPHVNLDAVPAVVPMETMEWDGASAVDGQPRIAGVSSFGITGTDCHVIIREAPQITMKRIVIPGIVDPPLNTLALSSKSEPHLEALIQEWISYLGNGQEHGIRDLCSAWNRSRRGGGQFAYRAAVSAATKEELKAQLEKLVKSQSFSHVPESRPKVAFLFPGQGAQYKRMGAELYESSATYRLHFDRAANYVKKFVGIDVLSVVMEMTEVDDPISSQCSIFVLEYALAMLWGSYGVTPDVVCGHSLGEFAAAVIAGLMDLEDACELVAMRAKFVGDNARGGAMAAVKLGVDRVNELIKEFEVKFPGLWVDVAGVNSSSQTVVAGMDRKTVELFLDHIGSVAKGTVLKSSAAYHSRDMDKIKADYGNVLKKIKFPKVAKETKPSFVSTVTGKIETQLSADYFLRHSRDAVQFEKAISVVLETEEVRTFIEIGPSPVLVALTAAAQNSNNSDLVLLPSLRKTESPWRTMTASLTKLYVSCGLNVNWPASDTYRELPEPITDLPKQPFIRKQFWYTNSEDDSVAVCSSGGGPSIHPLLGSHIPTAQETVLYDARMSKEKIGYLRDHSIGGRVIFPGAAYIEMALAAGAAAASTNNSDQSLLMPLNSVEIRDVTIEAPLCVDAPVKLQTSVKTSDEGDVNVFVHSGSGGRGNRWVRQATAVFVPLPMAHTLADEFGSNCSDFSVAMVRSDCAETVDVDGFYGELKLRGLEFGETFQSIKGVKRDPSSNHGYLVEIKKPSDIGEYLMHPVVMDAMIQSLMIGLVKSDSDVTRETNSLFVPVMIKRVLVAGGQKNWSAAELFAYSAGGRCVLFDGDENLICLMEGAEMIETSVGQILGSLDNQRLSLPSMYEEVWRSKLGVIKSRTEMGLLSRDELFSEKMQNKMRKHNWVTMEMQRGQDLRNRLVYLYAAKAIFELGVDLKFGAEISAGDLISKFGVLKSHERFLGRLLAICEEDGGLLLGDNTAEDCYVATDKFPKSDEEIAEQLESVLAEIGSHSDVRVMTSTGSVLSQILTGRVSALPILFPDDPTPSTSAEVFYQTTPLLSPCGYDCLREMLEEVFRFHAEKMGEEEKGVIRILEVGAGTGSSTGIFLSVLEQFNVKYAYTFSDVSPAFFIRARTTFEKYGKKMNYKVFNAEEDGVVQGFAPNYFDIVFASNVLHATRDIKESVLNVRNLLKQSGLLVLVETFRKVRDIDVVFGVLEGYWKFREDGVRVDRHPMVSEQGWRSVLKECGGVDVVTSFPAYGGYGGGILARAGAGFKFDPVSMETVKKPTWLVFGDDAGMAPLFDDIGRRVVLVTGGSVVRNRRCSYDNAFVAPMGDKEAMASVFKWVNESKTVLEGVVYLRGASSTDPMGAAVDFLNLSQCLMSEYKGGATRLIVVTTGVMPVGDQRFRKENLSEGVLWGMARTLRAELSTLFVRCVDMETDDEEEEKKRIELLAECFLDDAEYQVAYRGRTRHVLRFVSAGKELGVPLGLPPSGRFSLVLPKTKNIADLSFCATGKPTLKENQVEITVNVIGLNFRDVFVVLKPDPVFDNFNTVGLEFSGVVTATGKSVTKVKCGDLVIGCNFRGDALPSHAVADEDVVVPMMKDMTFHEAATVPAAFGTAFYCLVTVAKLSKGETVLVHAGSGGVGLFAIQVARAVGAEVIATAGSKRKRNYLRSLGVKHVFHSRNCNYGDEIEKIGDGGVDVVLNSLTSPGFKEASLRVLKNGGRFVEMSKMAVWSKEEVAGMRADVKYEIVDLTEVSKETWNNVWSELFKFTDAGHIKPVPYVSFDVGNIREALTYMQKARHIGKVLITMPNHQSVAKDSPSGPMTTSSRTLQTNLFNEFSSYLITGGLGGIGLEVARWMCGSGARNIILVSRRGPTEKSAKIVNDLMAKGFNIVVKSCDVGDLNSLKSLLKWVDSNLPPLRGVMHCAGTLSDATILNQTRETFETAYKGKVFGALNLHELTLSHRLEHFMLFSSIVAIFGPIGLSNYASANTYLDALAHYRNSVGLPAQTINWGQWGEVGAAANISIVALRAFTPSQGLAALELTMKSHKTQSCVLEVDFSSVRKLTGHSGNYLEELKISKDNNQVAFNVKMERFWDEYNVSEDKQSVIKHYIEMILKQILKFDEDDLIDENQSFSEMGMDSLMMLEMKNFVQTMLGRNFTLNVSTMSELTNVSKLVSYLDNAIKEMEENGGCQGDQQQKDYDTFSDELVKLINEDMELGQVLSPEVIKPCRRSEVKCILMTGVTGKFGPFLLKSMLDLSQIEKIYVIVRSRVNVSLKERVVKAIKDNLDEENADLDLSRVEILSGDVTEPMFGLFKPVYEELCSSVDAVVHCAVKGNLMDPYVRSVATQGTDIRTSNVVSTKNVIKFSMETRIKHILHCSTLLSNNKVDEENCVQWEGWYNAEDVFQLKNVGYPVSKFVCEVLCRKTADLGVPVQIFRYPALFGSSKTGKFPFPNNHAETRMLGFCKLGAVPAIPLPIQVMSSDVAADLTVETFFTKTDQSGAFNLSNPHLNYFQDFASVSTEMGFPMETLEFDKFSEKIKGGVGKQLFPYGEVDLDEGKYVEFSTTPQALQAWLKNPTGFFVSKKMTELFPDFKGRVEEPVKTLQRDLNYAVKSGIANQFGLKKA